MRISLRISLCLAVALSLALIGCGRDAPSGPDLSSLENLDPDDPASTEKAAKTVFEAIHQTELTEELMQDLYDLHRRVKAAEDNPVKAALLFRESVWDMQTYSMAMLKLEGLKTALKRGPEKAQQNVADARAQIADLEKRAAEATGEEKQGLEQAIQASRMMLTGLEQQAASSAKLNDPEYRAFIEGWIAKFEELESR